MLVPDFTALARERLIVDGERLTPDEARPVGFVSALQAPSREAVDALLRDPQAGLDAHFDVQILDGSSAAGADGPPSATGHVGERSSRLPALAGAGEDRPPAPNRASSETALGYTVSTNGGVRFGQAFTITSISAADDPGDIRTRSYGPITGVCLVMPGRVPLVHEPPLLLEVAKPMSDAPRARRQG